MKLALISVLISTTYVFADTSLPYQPEIDALCFKNGDPELANVGIPVLGSLGVKEGICQGIAGVTAAFLENAEFHEQVSTGSEPDAHSLITQLIENHRKGSREKVTVRGSKNLKEFCEKNKREFMRAAIRYNAEIATHKILPVLPDLYRLKKSTLENKEDLEKLQSQLTSLESTLQSGHYPLMLYFKHVVMVTSITQNELSVYDSNHPDETTILPLPQYMVWNLSY